MKRKARNLHSFSKTYRAALRGCDPMEGMASPAAFREGASLQPKACRRDQDLPRSGPLRYNSDLRLHAGRHCLCSLARARKGCHDHQAVHEQRRHFVLVVMTVSVLSNCCYYYYCCYYHQHLQPTKVRVGRVSPGLSRRVVSASQAEGGCWTSGITRHAIVRGKLKVNHEVGTEAERWLSAFLKLIRMEPISFRNT